MYTETCALLVPDPVMVRTSRAPARESPGALREGSDDFLQGIERERCYEKSENPDMLFPPFVRLSIHRVSPFGMRSCFPPYPRRHSMRCQA